MLNVEKDKGRGREGGVRGGLEQFNWNDVKTQSYSDREKYLGASVKVGLMGKLGTYNRHDWWRTKREGATGAEGEDSAKERLEEEREAVKRYEDEIRQEAMGLKPKRLLLQKQQLTTEQVTELFRKEKASAGAGATGGRPGDPDIEKRPMPEGEAGAGATTEEIDDALQLARGQHGLGFARQRPGAAAIGRGAGGAEAAAAAVKLEGEGATEEEHGGRHHVKKEEDGLEGPTGLHLQRQGTVGSSLTRGSAAVAVGGASSFGNLPDIRHIIESAVVKSELDMNLTGVGGSKPSNKEKAKKSKKRDQKKKEKKKSKKDDLGKNKKKKSRKRSYSLSSYSSSSSPDSRRKRRRRE